MSVSVSVERLRVWLLVGAGLLVAVVAAFLGYAHYRAHRFLTELPRKLGVDIQQETNAFTYSQSVQGRTVYTIHAAKAIQHKDGKYTLRDVGIVLYGRKQDRADRIYGSEFEYDQTAGVIRAMGEVHIDLQAPEAAGAREKMDYAAGKDMHGAGAHDSKDERLIHVKTSGLVFMKELGVAATDKDIEFESGGMTGHAVGADYSSDTGVVVLHSAVRAIGLQHGQPVVLTADRAELDRVHQRVSLVQAKYVSVGAGQGAAGATRTVEARQVVVHLRQDGTAERLEAEGAVTLKNGAGGTVTAPRGTMVLNAANQPQSAVLTGGVRYFDEEPLRKGQGEWAEGRATFDKSGRAEHVSLTGGVHVHEQVRSSVGEKEAWSERALESGAVEIALAADGAGKAQLRDAKATGDAKLRVVSPAGKSGVAASSDLAGEILTAHFVRDGGRDHLAEVRGEGHTTLRRVSATGVVSTSSGDSLEAHFKPVAGVAGAYAGKGGQKGLGEQGAEEISTATQQGHVLMTQRPVQRAGDTAAPVEERATAERVLYDGQLERTTLSGNVEVASGGSSLWADRVVTEQQTGDATADGSVKASYKLPGGGDEPVHVLAGRAELKHDSQVALFYGVAGRQARLWQGGSQVEAPVLQFEQKQRRLVARSDGKDTTMAVHTVMVNGGGSAVKPGAAARKTDVVRVISRELTYSDEARKAEFTGGVHVESADGSMKGQQAVVYLQAAGAKGGDKVTAAKAAGTAKPSGFMGGSVERVVATGAIEIDQPGRHGSGEQVVYTASDGMFVLTGTAGVLPKIMDDQRGTVTGTSLRFHAGDESVVVSNGGDGSGQRVRTETRVKK